MSIRPVAWAEIYCSSAWSVSGAQGGEVVAPAFPRDPQISSIL